jgi:hypothetical protein
MATYSCRSVLPHIVVIVIVIVMTDQETGQFALSSPFHPHPSSSSCPSWENP